MKIAGIVAVVTGAGSGLGLATAKMLADRGAKVVAIDLSYDQLKGLGSHDAILPMPADVSDSESIEQVFEQVREQVGIPRILVNCAGILGPARVFTIDKATGEARPRGLDVFRKVIDINLTGTFNTIRCFSAGLSNRDISMDEDNGVIINTASVAAYEALSAQTAYGSSKAGVVSMTLPLARELARYGIRVMSLAPGTFETGMYEVVPTHTRDMLIKDVPYPQRPGHPDEFAHMAIAILENSMMNGSVVRIDGAVRMREPTPIAGGGAS